MFSTRFLIFKVKWFTDEKQNFDYYNKLNVVNYLQLIVLESVKTTAFGAF